MPAHLRLSAIAVVLMFAGVTSACQVEQVGASLPGCEPAQPAQPQALPPSGPSPAPAQNVILIVGDGMGQAHRELIRLGTVGCDAELVMDQLQYQGWTETDSADPDGSVTDSAAAATALATGERTANGSIAVDLDGRPLTTLLERAERAGKATGLVTTARVTDATPAAFGAHAPDRGHQSEIARQYLEETTVDVILGGGEDWWYPPETEGGWPDRPPTDPEEVSKGTAGNLVERARELGYEYVRDADELALADGPQLLGLFANEEMFEDDAETEASYDPAVPLPVMAAKALELLSRDEDGFFLVIEEEGVDAMSHRGDARLVIEAGRALDETVALARAFAIEDGRTLLVVVGDHETGGLTIAYTDQPVADDDNGPFAVVLAGGVDATFVAEWETGGHTGADTPASAEGPGAEGMVEVRANIDIHDLVLQAMRLDER